MNALLDWLMNIDTLLTIGAFCLGFMLLWTVFRIGLEVMEILLTRVFRLVWQISKRRRSSQDKQD